MKTRIIDRLQFQPATIVFRIALAAAILLPAIMYMSPNAQGQQAAGNHAPSVIPVSLITSLDSSHKKVGDAVEGKVDEIVKLPDGRTIARGTKIVGHITESKARSKGDSDSELGFVFDKIMLGHGETVIIAGGIRAVGPNPDTGLGGGGVDYGNSINRSLQHSVGSPGGTATVPILNDQSDGVVGIKDLELSSSGVLKSSDKSVKLGTGSQIVVRVDSIGAK